MTKAEASLEALLAMLDAGMTPRTLDAVGAEHPDIIRTFADYDPFELASSFGTLALMPELQCCCVRLEALTHLALLHGAGRRKPTPKVLARAFATLKQGHTGMMEDPAEDVFVTSVTSRRGNFRCLEGIWESAGFFLQRFVNLVEEMPNGEPFATLRENVFALLKLSDLACERAGLVRWQVGASAPIRTLPDRVVAKAGSLRRRLIFSEESLKTHGIAMANLVPFVFPPSQRSALASQKMGNSFLDCAPVLWRNDAISLALPTAVSAAVRRLVIDFANQHGQLKPLVHHLSDEYAKTLTRTPLLSGKFNKPIRFQHNDRGSMAGAMIEVDTGRYLNLVFVLDTLKDFDVDGLNGFNGDLEALHDQIADWDAEAARRASANADFRDGITLIVSCGVGRGARFSATWPERPSWRHEFISASDLYTLSWTKDFELLSLWRLLDAEAHAAAHGIGLANVNGLLNRIAWRRALGGHLVPHRTLPDDFGQDGRETLMMIDQSSLRGLREEVLHLSDPHAVKDVDGRWIRVRKDRSSLFTEDKRHPSHYPEDVTDTLGLPHIYEAPNRPWWCEIAVTKDNLDAMTYERWKMLETWNTRLAPVLDASLATLPPGPVLWRVHFAGDRADLGTSDRPGFAEAKADITITHDTAHNTVEVHIGRLFENAFLNLENVAERALVERAVEGFLALAGGRRDSTEVQRLVNCIVRDPKARQTHTFRNGGFRDRVRLSGWCSEIVVINDDDEADHRVGLGWRVRSRVLGGNIVGKEACTTFLNTLVSSCEDELCAELRQYDRLLLLTAALENHEAAADERSRWQRTASANVALHGDKESIYAAIAQRESQLAGVSQTTRTLCEIALCECPLSGGRRPGKLDLARLMAKTALIINLGGWSDAIWLDAAEPKVRVTPLGDVHLNHDFVEEVVMPFGRAASDVRTNDSIKNYARNLEEMPLVPSVEHNFAPAFLEAIIEEMGAGLDETRIFIEHLENLAVIAGEAILILPRSQLLTPTVEGHTVPAERAAALFEALSIPRRSAWRDVPAGFHPQDIRPWRYRRQLSLLRRPLLQLDDKDDPTVMVAPGLLRDGFAYSLANFWRGDFRQNQLKPKMRSWRGAIASERGTAFNVEVAARLRQLGWKARSDVNVSAILGSEFRSNGDIDVLAWHPETGRVLLTECKDLLYGKTFGEIAEQLADFRGEVRADGKRDALRRHLDRIDVLQAHQDKLAAFVGLAALPSIEGHLVFKNPVPMAFAGRRISTKVHLHVFDDLTKL